MKKNLWLAALIMTASLVSVSFTNATNRDTTAAYSTEISNDNDSTIKEAAAESLSTLLYNGLNLKSKGLSQEAVAYAVNGYQKLEAAGEVSSPYLTIVDFSQSSRKKRFYIIDMENQTLVKNTFVSHGKNSGVDMATRFSNVVGSEASSLGFYVTKGTYTGKHGLSLRIDGKERGFNDNAERRAVVVHGADYVNAARVNSAYMGRSQGCPALPMNEYREVINTIKNGSVMFIYAPSDNYLQGSKLIKG